MNKVMVAGHEIDLKRGVDYIGVCVIFAVHDGKGNLLMQRRNQTVRDEQGTWDVGGGSVEFGEEREDAVRREVKEEYCADPKNIKFLTAYDAHRQNKGIPTHWIALMHAVEVDAKKVAIGEPDKISEIGWFNLNNLPSPLHSQVDKTIKYAVQYGIIA